MIKKILLGILIILSGIGYTNAYLGPTITVNLPGNFSYGTDVNNIDNELNFQSDNGNYLHITDNGVANNEYYVFRNNKKLYVYGYYGYYHSFRQGYYNAFCKTYGTGYCNGEGNTPFTKQIAEEFYNLEDVNFTQFIGSFQGETDDPGLCFYNINNNTTYCTQTRYALAQMLSGNLNIQDNTTNFNNYAKNSPFTKNANNSTTNVGNCPTIGQLMKNMGENYNTGLCYNNTTYFNGTNFEQTDQEDIFTIFNNDYQNYVNRISIYRNNCTNANTTQACQNAFSGEYKKYSIISNAINSNVDEKKLRNYCNLGLNYDPNTTTCVASGGGIKEEYNNEEIMNEIINNGIIVTPGTNETGTNNVLNALNKCENGNRECYVNNRDFIDSLKNIYGKITGLFRERNGVNGIIPNYILRITFITILFTVIFKK